MAEKSELQALQERHEYEIAALLHAFGGPKTVTQASWERAKKLSVTREDGPNGDVQYSYVPKKV